MSPLEIAAFMYDEAGQVKKMFLNDGNQIYNSYNDFNEQGLLKRMRLESGEGVFLLNDRFIHDDNGNIKEIHQLNGSRIVYDYYEDNQLKREQYVNASGVITLELGYTYDFLGNRIEMTRGASTTRYEYDKANQLVNIGGVSLAYDDNGNMISDGTRNYQYNGDNELITVSNGSVGTYDYNHEGLRSRKW